MKRSEMIDLLVNKAKEYRGCFVDDREILTAFLDLIESKGMLPPQVGKHSIAHFILDPVFDDDATCVHFWEEE